MDLLGDAHHAQDVRDLTDERRSPVDARCMTLKVRTGVKAGSADDRRIALNHTEPVLRVRTGVKAGSTDRIAMNHSEPVVR